MTTRRCEGCGAPFQARTTRQRICQACPGGRWENGKFRFQRTCQICQQPFYTYLRSQRSCSVACGARLGNTRVDLREDLDAIRHRMSDATIRNAVVNVTAIRRRLTPEEAEQLKRCPTCTGKMLLLSDDADPNVLTLACMLCGREYGQLRPKSPTSRFGWQPVVEKA